MIKEDVLKVEFIEVFDGKYAAKVTYQNTDILKRGIFYDDEIKVKSSQEPHLNNKHTLYIRGLYEQGDNSLEFLSREMKEIVEHKVRLINERYGKIKLWRAEKLKRYNRIFIGNGKIDTCELEDYHRGMYNDDYNNGNYFETKEEAEEYAEKIRNMFKERFNG